MTNVAESASSSVDGSNETLEESSLLSLADVNPSKHAPTATMTTMRITTQDDGINVENDVINSHAVNSINGMTAIFLIRSSDAPEQTQKPQSLPIRTRRHAQSLVRALPSTTKSSTAALRFSLPSRTVAQDRALLECLDRALRMSGRLQHDDDHNDIPHDITPIRDILLEPHRSHFRVGDVHAVDFETLFDQVQAVAVWQGRATRVVRHPGHKHAREQHAARIVCKVGTCPYNLQMVVLPSQQLASPATEDPESHHAVNKSGIRQHCITHFHPHSCLVSNHLGHSLCTEHFLRKMLLSLPDEQIFQPENTEDVAASIPKIVTSLALHLQESMGLDYASVVCRRRMLQKVVGDILQPPQQQPSNDSPSKKKQPHKELLVTRPVRSGTQVVGKEKPQTLAGQTLSEGAATSTIRTRSIDKHHNSNKYINEISMNGQATTTSSLSAIKTRSQTGRRGATTGGSIRKVATVSSSFSSCSLSSVNGDHGGSQMGPLNSFLNRRKRGRFSGRDVQDCKQSINRFVVSTKKQRSGTVAVVSNSNTAAATIDPHDPPQPAKMMMMMRPAKHISFPSLVEEYKSLVSQGHVEAVYFGATMAEAEQSMVAMIGALEGKLLSNPKNPGKHVPSEQPQDRGLLPDVEDPDVVQDEKDYKKSLKCLNGFREQECLTRAEEKEQDRIEWQYRRYISRNRRKTVFEKEATAIVKRPIMFASDDDNDENENDNRSAQISKQEICPLAKTVTRGGSCSLCHHGEELVAVVREQVKGAGVVVPVPHCQRLHLLSDETWKQRGLDNDEPNDADVEHRRKKSDRMVATKQKALNTIAALKEMRNTMRFIEEYYQTYGVGFSSISCKSSTCTGLI